MARAGITWSGPLEANLARLDTRLRDRIGRVMGGVAPKIEADMKVNAPWTDRTTNARNSLRAEAKGGVDQASIILSGNVPYMIWLETRWSGRYAIIGPSMLKWGPKVIELCARAVFRG